MGADRGAGRGSARAGDPRRDAAVPRDGSSREDGVSSGDAARAGDPPFEELLGDFYSPGVPLDRLRPRPAAAGPADLLLRMLEPPAVKVRHIPLIDLLRKPYRELGSPDR
ncbi:hypothetical protein ACFYSC_12430 [Streptosporangium sp. NPDC004379]|uniref:hypothetical protein n=1 Tax=Streptosporangium sp. NPDC004379 TaxID=3366189 RepID=UPI00367BC08D